MKYITLLLGIMVTAAVLNGCSASKEATTHIMERDIGGKLIHDRVTIKPGGSYEECIELGPGLVFDYEYDASEFVNFNIHYHAETGLYYPVNSMGVRFGKGTIDPEKHIFYTQDQDNYCLMWENLNDLSLEVSYKCVLRKK